MQRQSDQSNIDSATGDNEFAPFMNIIAEWYARDTSKKIRAVMKNKGDNGEHLCTNPPYGYRKDPDNPKQWIVDEEAAEVVRRISACVLRAMARRRLPGYCRQTRFSLPLFTGNLKAFPALQSHPKIRISGTIKRLRGKAVLLHKPEF